jgi:ribosomal protein S18 acetylase RimI-like enzyme
MPVTVRRATPADAATVVDFNCRLANESEGKTLDPETVAAGVASGLADPSRALYFVAEVDGRIVGQTMITFEWSDWRNGWIWWIQSVYVQAEARRRGVFRALFRHIHEIASRDPKVVAIRLYVEEQNRAAQDTYRELGLSPAGYFVLEKHPL